MSFDPLAFTRLTAREQREALLDLVNIDVDLAALDRDRAALYEERTHVGRAGKALGTIPDINPDLPEVEVSAQDLLGQIRAAEQQQRTRDDLTARLDLCTTRGKEVTQAIAELQAELASLTTQHTSLQKEIAALPEAVDTTELEQRLADVEDVNAQIRANQQAKALAAEAEKLRDQYSQLTEQINALDRAKTDALAAAKFPVDGLSFDADGVLFNGVPFSQASSAEQIRVSLAMAMALNPKLRVIRILDGSLLDDDSMKLITDAATSNDYQVWIERVSDPSESAVVIEDGQVKA